MRPNVCAPVATSYETRASAMPFALRQPMRRATDFLGNAEPHLDDLMDDELMGRLMSRDGVGRDQLLTLIERVRAGLS